MTREISIVQSSRRRRSRAGASIDFTSPSRLFRSLVMFLVKRRRATVKNNMEKIFPQIRGRKALQVDRFAAAAVGEAAKIARH